MSLRVAAGYGRGLGSRVAAPGILPLLSGAWTQELRRRTGLLVAMVKQIRHRRILDEQARHARGKPTRKERLTEQSRIRHHKYEASHKGKQRQNKYKATDKAKRTQQRYNLTIRQRSTQRSDRMKVAELRDAAASVGKAVKDVAPQTGQVGKRALDAVPEEEIFLDGQWSPAVQTLVDDEQVNKMFEGLTFISSLKCATCDRCQGRWFVTPSLDKFPLWATETTWNHSGLFQRTGWRLTVDQSSGRAYCPMCLPVVLQAAKQSCPIPPPPDFGLDCTVIDALTDFEELLLCPVHCVVQVYVIWASGHLKYRNFTYGVEQDVARFFETVPPAPEDVPVLQIKRGHLSWRQPFVANRSRLMAAYAWLRTKEKYMARRWNQWYSEQGQEYQVPVPSRDLPEGMDNLEIGRDLVNAWLGVPEAVEGVGLAAQWQTYRRTHFGDAADTQDFDIVRRAISANLRVVLENQGQHSREQITALCRDARNMSTYRLLDFAMQMSCICDVDEETILVEGAGQIQKFASAHDAQQSGGVGYADGDERGFEESAGAEDAVREFVRDVTSATCVDGFFGMASQSAADARGRAALAELRSMTVLQEPPRGQAVTENTPYMMANMFVKIHPCLEGDFTDWKGTFVDWVWSVVVRSQGRAMRHPRWRYAVLDRLWRSLAAQSRKAFWRGAPIDVHEAVNQRSACSASGCCGTTARPPLACRPFAGGPPAACPEPNRGSDAFPDAILKSWLRSFPGRDSHSQNLRFTARQAEEKMRTEDGVKELVSMLNMFTKPLPGSPKQKGMDLSDLEAMLAQCDDEGLKAALFVTHTCPAAKHELCQRLIREYGGVDGPPAVAGEVVEDVAKWEKDANANAFLVAYYAELRLTIALDFLVQHVRSVCRLKPDDRVDFWVTPEWGTQFGNRHDHIVLLLPRVPTIGFDADALDDDIDGDFDGVPDLSTEKVEAVASFFDRLVLECNLDKPPVNSNDAQTFWSVGRKRARKGARKQAPPTEELLGLSDADEFVDPRCYTLSALQTIFVDQSQSRSSLIQGRIHYLSRLQDASLHDYHEPHPWATPKSGTCMRTREGQTYCSGGFPREAVRQGEERIAPDLHRKGIFGLRLRRNCAYVTPHMPLPHVMTQASLDAQPILTMGGLSAYMNKLAAYMSKGRNAGHDKQRLGARLFEECRKRSTHGGAFDVIAKYTNRTQAPAEIVDIEVSHHLMGLPGRKVSRSFVTLSMDGGQKTMLKGAELKRAIEQAGGKRGAKTSRSELDSYEIRCPCVCGDCECCPWLLDAWAKADADGLSRLAVRCPVALASRYVYKATVRMNQPRKTVPPCRER